MDAFQPSDKQFLEEARGDLPMVRLASWVMFFLGGIYILFGVLFGLVYSAIPLMDSSMENGEAMFFVGFGVVFGVLMAGIFGVPIVAGGYGLRQGKMWAWVLTVCVGGLFATSACMPFGIFLLYAMLNETTRNAFLK